MQALLSEDQDRLRQQVVDACDLVAQSWPLKTFAYRNPLRGLENLPFDQAIRRAKHSLGGNGYLTNDEYRQLYRSGAITEAAIDRALQATATNNAPQAVTVGTRQITSADVHRLHLLFGFDSLQPALHDWQLGAGGSVEQFRSDLPLASQSPSDGPPTDLKQLWAGIQSAVKLSEAARDSSQPPVEEFAGAEVDLPAGRSLSDWLGSLTGSSVVERINDQMIKWVSAFLDEGMASWEMPERGAGFYEAWRSLAQKDFSGRFLGIKKCGRKIRELPVSAEDAVVARLKCLGIPEHRWADYLSRQLAQLPGWTGFIRWRSENPDYHPQQNQRIDLVQYLAVRLFYEVELVQVVCRRDWRIEGTLPGLVACWKDRPEEYQRLMFGDQYLPTGPDTEAVCRDGWRLFHLAQFLELPAGEVAGLSGADVRQLLDWLDAFPSDTHGAVWLDALESTYRDELIAKLSSEQAAVAVTESSLRAQLVFCIDVRSESMRRHIEARGAYETLGFAGFFGIPISYQPFDSQDQAALCPVILSPGFAVQEVARPAEHDSLQTYAASSRWGELGDHLFHDLKRNPITSLMLIDVVGLFFGVWLAGKTFFHHGFQSVTTRLKGWFSRQIATEIPVDQKFIEQGGEPASLPHGFTLTERAAFVENALRAIGITEHFGRFVVLCGHGSTSDNNPYFAAYNCGACGGGHGDANARVFANMGNDPEVRQAVRENGLEIPEETWFLAAKHNTVTDTITFYDQQDVPASHVEDLRKMAEDLAEASAIQAQQRGHRIPQAPQNLSPRQARDHMQSRSVDWANVRPEWGLSSNAAFVLGRRSLTRSVDLDGRVFLQSYDPLTDQQGGVLEALMTAPLVVAQWISMEYYFSAVDPCCYGSGSKVTHNVVSGIGVMHGAHGDLQSGLPLQSVNDGAAHYHKPVRLLAVIEAPTSRIESAIGKHVLLQDLLHNQWIHLVAVDPVTREFQRYSPDGSWESVV